MRILRSWRDCVSPHLPARLEPRGLLPPEDQAGDPAIPDDVDRLPAYVAPAQGGRPRLAVEGEDPLLLEGVFEVPDVEGGRFVADRGRGPAVSRMPVVDRQDGRGHDGPASFHHAGGWLGGVGGSGPASRAPGRPRAFGGGGASAVGLMTSGGEGAFSLDGAVGNPA